MIDDGGGPGLSWRIVDSGGTNPLRFTRFPQFVNSWSRVAGISRDYLIKDTAVLWSTSESIDRSVEISSPLPPFFPLPRWNYSVDPYRRSGIVARPRIYIYIRSLSFRTKPEERIVARNRIVPSGYVNNCREDCVPNYRGVFGTLAIYDIGTRSGGTSFNRLLMIFVYREWEKEFL